MRPRERFQHGSVMREKRKHGAAVWTLRWRETDGKGQTIRRKEIIGTVEEYPTKASARKACEFRCTTINRETRTPRTIAELVTHYREKEMTENGSKSYSTRTAYAVYLRNWIVPKWGEFSLSDVRTVAVEDWLRTLSLSNGSRAKIRNLMSTVFNHAMRYEWADRNPIRLVRQSAKRERTPDVLTAEEIKSLLSKLRRRLLRHGFSRRCNWASRQRTAGLEVGGRRLCSGRDFPHPCDCLSARRPAENSSIAETRSNGRGIVRPTAGLARTMPLQSRQRLRLCIC